MDNLTREEPCCCHLLGFYFRLYATSHMILHTTTFVILVVEHWLEREITHWDPSHHELALAPAGLKSIN